MSASDDTAPALGLVPDCGRDRHRAKVDEAWKAQLQRHGDKSRSTILHERHFARDFGPVPPGGAEVVSIDQARRGAE